MEKLFGIRRNNKNKKKKSTSSQDVTKAIIKLRETISMLEKKKALHEKKINNYTKEAQSCLKKKNRKGALAKLKLKKQIEKRAETLDNQIFNLEMQIMTLDETLTNKTMIDAMGTVRNHLNTQNIEQQMNDAEELQDDLADAMDMQRDLASILGTSFVDYDDDELNAELEELDFLDDDGLLYGQQINSKPPSVNKNKKKKQDFVIPEEDEVEDEEEEEEETESAEEAEIKKLEMEMNQNGNNKNLIDVQIVTSSTKNRMMIQSF